MWKLILAVVVIAGTIYLDREVILYLVKIESQKCLDKTDKIIKMVDVICQNNNKFKILYISQAKNIAMAAGLVNNKEIEIEIEYFSPVVNDIWQVSVSKTYLIYQFTKKEIK